MNPVKFSACKNMNIEFGVLGGTCVSLASAWFLYCALCLETDCVPFTCFNSCALIY